MSIKAIYRMLRASTESALETNLKNGEIGLVVGSPIVKANDNGSFREMVLDSEDAVLRTLVFDGTYEAGVGGTPASPEAITNATRAVVTVAPSTTGTDDSYSLDAQTTDAKIMCILNKGSVPALITLPSTRIMKIMEGDAHLFISFDSAWYPLPNKYQDDLTVDQSTPFGGSAEATWRFFREKGDVRVLIGAESASIDAGQGGNAYVTFDLPAGYDDYQPAWDSVCPIILDRNGAEVAGYLLFSSSSREVSVYLIGGTTWVDSDLVTWSPQTVHYDIVETSFY